VRVCQKGYINDEEEDTMNPTNENDESRYERSKDSQTKFSNRICEAKTGGSRKMDESKGETGEL
jgi:hypothetical protein